ncbi:MAG: hypothetical protein ABI995_09490, partial [Acidobacteriota bacterium]
MRTFPVTVILAVCASSGLAQGPAKGKGKAGAPLAVRCDRACLDGYVDRWLDAMVAHDAKKAPFAKDAKFTENGQR